MQKYYDTLNALRDIIDVLYDGTCKRLEEEELYSTVVKKLKELRRCSQKEKKYKLHKILNILVAVNQEDLPKSFIQEINLLNDQIKK